MPGILDGGTFPGTEAPDLAPATETADSKQEESAVLVMTDIHYGRKTSSYNPSVCLERLDRVGAHLARVRQLLAEYNITELVIALIGDVNDGTDIYATQPHHQAITNVEHQARELSTYLAHWLEKQSQVWPSIRVEAVPGNHGRAGRFAHDLHAVRQSHHARLRCAARGKPRAGRRRYGRAGAFPEVDEVADQRRLDARRREARFLQSGLLHRG